MAVPTFDKFIEPLLRFLSTKPEGAPASDAYEATAQALNLTDIDRQELLPSGIQATYKNRAGWAQDRLKRAGLAFTPNRGVWQLTEKGFELAKQHTHAFSLQEIEHIATAYMDIRLTPSFQTGDQPYALSSDPGTITKNAVASPDDRLGDAISELRLTVKAELLEILAKVSPSFFETIVLDVLHRMGYGASRADLLRVGGSGDGGIDGVISLDKLGLEKVCVQAKRWQGTVGRPEIQAFFGALDGQRVNKGVFITTSGFTVQAIEFAKSVEGIILVDGLKLAEFMIDHEVGISARTIKVPKVDSDYFDEVSN